MLQKAFTERSGAFERKQRDKASSVNVVEKSNTVIISVHSTYRSLLT